MTKQGNYWEDPEEWEVGADWKKRVSGCCLKSSNFLSDAFFDYVEPICSHNHDILLYRMSRIKTVKNCGLNSLSEN